MLDSHLIHTCTIENPASGSTNAYNNAKKSYAQPLENVRCRLIDDRERVWSDERQENMIQSVYMLMVLAGVELNERAKISKVTMEDGSEINDLFEVTEVIVRRGRNSHHKTAVLERIS